MIGLLKDIWRFYSAHERRILICVAVIGIVMINGLGRFEGKINPVFDGFSHSVSQIDDSSSKLYFDFNKLRSECAFRSVEFFIVENRDTDHEQVLQVSGQFMGKEMARYAGFQERVGPWLIRADAEQLQDMFIIFRHRCHATFYTITRYNIKDGVAKRY